MTLRPEEIYEAAVDDEAFAHLADALARDLGARSGVLHWVAADGGREELSHTGYFSPEQMQRYGENFGNDDLWAAAVRSPVVRDKAWDCASLVPASVYEKSRIYNEWIRPMGDDTYHCLGGVVRAGPVTAEIGFHRGRSQRPFGPDEVGALDRHLVHLRQLISIRDKLAAASRAEQSLAASQDAIGYGLIVMTAGGRILHCNRHAEAILRRGDGLVMIGGRLQPFFPADRRHFEIALATAASRTRAVGALRVARTSGGFYEVSIIATWTGMRVELQLVVHDRGERDGSVIARLRSLYGLTDAEAAVAEALVGSSIDDLAEARGTSVGTIRSQIKAIAGKLGCKRQSEIVAVVCDLPKLTLGDGS